MKYSRVSLCLIIASGVFCGASLAENTLESYQRTAEKYPAYDVAHYSYANALYKAGMTERAIGEYRAAYSVTRSEQMRAFCGKMLQQLGVPVAGSMSSAGLAVRRPGWMSQESSSPLQKFHDMAHSERLQDRQSDSHSGGVVAFKQTPGPEFNSWITEFRLRYGKLFQRQLNARGFRGMAGQTQMVFSVDKEHHLRSRIVNSTAPPAMTNCLLDAVRYMDGKSLLDFPQSSNIDGFNFAMSWVYPELPSNEVSAALRSGNTGARLTAQGNRATAAVGYYNDTRGTIVSTYGSGQLRTPSGNGAVAGKLRTPAGAEAVTGKLGGGDVTISTDVAAMIVPKAIPKAMKASPALRLK